MDHIEHYHFASKVLADAFILLVNKGEGIPIPGSDTLTYAEAFEVKDNDDNTLHWGVVKDDVTEKYY